MSKLDIGVGEDFPLGEGSPEQDSCAWNEEYGARRRARLWDRCAHHHHSGHFHAGHGLLHLPLIVAIATIAALIGAGRIPALATHSILVLAAVLVVTAMIAHFWHRRRHHWNKEHSER